MLLSEADARLLEREGHSRNDFVLVNRQSFAHLKNQRGHCFFYDIDKKRCRAYKSRPLGCRIYPVVYSEDEARVLVDDLCPMGNTVSDIEIERKGKKLVRLLRRIDKEAAQRARVSV
jgi:hypothetical protein